MNKQELQLKNQSGQNRIGASPFLFLALVTIVIISGFHYSCVNTNNPDKVLTFDEIAALADEYQLNNQTDINKHLSFIPDDFHYWTGQQLTQKELEAQFEARRIVLDLARKENREIISQEDLAAEAEILIIKKMAQKYNLDNAKIHSSYLVLDEGDFNYWRNKDLSLNEIEKRFKIMDIILRDAEENNTPINSKNELGYLVEKKIEQ